MAIVGGLEQHFRRPHVGLAINAAAANLLTQGIALAAGLQSSFNWRAVAVSAVAAPAVRALGSTNGTLGQAVGGGLMGQTAQAMFNGVVRQSIRMAIYSQGKLDYAAIAADAFGNALGESIVAQSQTQGQGPWSSADYRNGSDIESDNYVAPVAGSGLRLSGPSNAGLRLGGSANAAWGRGVDSGIRDAALALANWDAVVAKNDERLAALAKTRRLERNRASEAYGQELAQAAQRAKWDAMQVGGWAVRSRQAAPAETPMVSQSVYTANGDYAGTKMVPAGAGPVRDPWGESLVRTAKAAWNDPVQAGLGVLMSAGNVGPSLVNLPITAAKLTAEGYLAIGNAVGLVPDVAYQNFRDVQPWQMHTWEASNDAQRFGLGAMDALMAVGGGASAWDQEGKLGILRESAFSASPAPVHFMEASDRFMISAAKRVDVDPNGLFDVIAHGTPTRIEINTPFGAKLIDAEIAVSCIKYAPGYDGQDIRLLSCSTGASDTGFAQNLANKMENIVHAPNDVLWATDNENLFFSSGVDYFDPAIGRTVSRPAWPPTGKFVTFYPKGTP